MEDEQEASVDNKDKSRKALSRIEIFGFVTGLIGLVADAISLVTFAAGVWGFTNDEGSVASGYGLFIVVTGLLLIYGWLVLAWIITVRTLRRGSVPPTEGDVVNKGGLSTGGIGLLLIPLAIIWFAIAFSGNNATSSEIVSTTVAITPTSPVNQTPISSTPTASPPSKAEAATVNTVFAMLLLYPFAGLGVFGCIDLLVPLVYEDLAKHNVRVITAEHNERVRAYIEDHWDDLEERISIKFERYNWIEVSNLQDLADLLEVPLESMEIVLAKYAWIHPTKVEYGYLRGDHYRMSKWKVLVKSDFDLKDHHMEME